MDWEGGKSAGGWVRAEEYRLWITARGVPAPCEDAGLPLPEDCTCLHPGGMGWRDGGGGAAAPLGTAHPLSAVPLFFQGRVMSVLGKALEWSRKQHLQKTAEVRAEQMFALGCLC